MIKVISRRGAQPYTGVYIGRPNPLGNPFILGQDGTRDEVIAKYRTWLVDKWFTEPDSKTHIELKRFIQKYKDDGQLTLVCWCAPLACHGNVIREAIIHESV